MTAVSGDHRPAPDVTVVIPTHGRPAALDACLASLGAQDLDAGRFEVVVVDDGGETDLDPIVARHRGTLRLTLIRQERSGPAAARNAGAAQAAAPLLAFTDDDCLPAPEWLAALRAAHAGPSGALIAGQTVNALDRNRFASASQALLDHLYADGSSRRGEIPFVASNNLAIARRDFEACGGFDQSFRLAGGEDRDFSDRARSLGFEIVYAPDALVHHAHPLALAGFVRQHFAYGRGAFLFHRRRVRRGGPPLRIETPAFYGSMLSDPFRRLPFGRAVARSALLVLSQVSTAAGFVVEGSAAAAGSGMGRRRFGRRRES